MAIEYYSSIDLNKNELQNAVVQNAGSAPGSPAEGQIYYDSTSGDKAIHFYNGSAWIRVAGQANAQTTDTIASGDFIAFSDESETGDINNKLTVDNLFKTAPAILSTAAIANGDFIMFLDGGATGETKLEALADVATLFAGAGMTAGSSVMNVIGGDGITANADNVAITAAQTTVTTVTNAALKLARDGHNFIDFATDNQIKFTVSTNQAITFKASGEIEATKFDGALEGNADTATLAATATHVLVSDNESANEENEITFVEDAAAGGAQRGLESSAKATFNPSTGGITATSFIGKLTIGAHTLDDVNVNAEFVNADDTIMTAKAIGTRFGLKAGSSDLVTTGDLEGGTITTGFGAINNGGSAITTTGLISGGSLDIDDVLINGSNIGHTDDTDLIVLADGAVTVNGSLTVTGTTTTNNVETVSTSSGVIFEGGTADGHDATLKSVVAGADVTYTLPNVAGFVGLFAADPGTTTITSTPAELNKLDGATVVVGEINALDLGSTAIGNAIASKAVVLDSSKDFTGINSLGADNYVIGGHTIDDIDITAQFVDADAHIMSSKAIGARFALKNADTTGTATNSLHVLVTDNENTDEENQITFIEGAGGGTAQRGLEADGHLTYNPSSGTVSATIFKGNIDAVNGDFDGTLEADALTINGTAIVAQATASAVGGVELATAAEVLTGTDTARVVTADTLAARTVVGVIDVSSLTDALIVTIPHNLGTADVMVQMYDITTEATVYADIARTTDDFSTASTSSISIDFGTAPPNDIRVMITSFKGASASGTVAYT